MPLGRIALHAIVPPAPIPWRRTKPRDWQQRISDYQPHGQEGPKTMIKFTTLTLVGLAIAPPAYATTLNCGPPTTWIGDPGRYPVVQTTINVTGDSWTVIHYTSYSYGYNRGDQYDMKDFPRPDKKRQWHGTRNNNPNLFMDGVVFNERGRTWYEERLHDINQHSNRTGDLTSYTVQDCGPATSLPNSIIASAPTPSNPPRGPSLPPNTYGEVEDEIIPLRINNDSAYVTVKLGAHTVTMLVDTGASLTKITPAMANQLISEGQAEYTGEHVTMNIADGSLLSHPMQFRCLTVPQFPYEPRKCDGAGPTQWPGLVGW
jgi:hypothetical protein